MRARLLLGPFLYLALVAIIWIDDRLGALTLPGWLDAIFPGDPRLPPGVPLALVAAVIAVASARELTAMLRLKGIASSPGVNIAAALLALLPASLAPAGAGTETVPTLALIALVGSMLYHARHRSFEDVMLSAAAALLAFVYLGLALAFLLAIRRDAGAWVVLYVLTVTKAADIGAYFAGSAVGRHKLIEWLSPGKTWEGLLGGLVFASIIAIVGARLLRPHETAAWMLTVGALSGAIFTLAGLLGDLVASLFKRDAHLKDASRTLPGYGGVLDLIDSPLLVAPVAYWCIRILL